MLGILKGRSIEVRVPLLAATLTLTFIGIITIYAIGNLGHSVPNGQPLVSLPALSSSNGSNQATQTDSDDTGPVDELAGLWKKQLLFAGLGLAALAAVNLVNYRRLGELSYWLYAMVLVMLAVLLVDKFINLPFVPLVNGSRRWIRLPLGLLSLSIQPSELCKPAYVLALAWYLRYRSNFRSFRVLVAPFILTLLPAVLILLEPDLGTVLLMLPIFLAMLFAAGAKPKHLIMLILAGLLLSPILWHKLEPYQRLRISSVLLQNQWLRGEAQQHPALGNILVGTSFSVKRWKDDWGYHLIRSKYAVASGGASGYGFGKGPFIKYNFLPERHNDFIFAIIAHQWGFWGCILVLALYVLILWCGLEIAVETTDPFARLLVTGILAVFALQVIVNVAMTVGLMPITGITLPFVSYGGSSLLVSLLCIGLLNNVGRWRPFTVAPKL